MFNDIKDKYNQKDRVAPKEWGGNSAQFPYLLNDHFINNI